MKFLKEHKSLGTVAALLSAFTLIAYHVPFFRFVTDNVEGDLNGIQIVASLAVLMFSLNYFFYYLVLYCGRMVGKCILAFSLVANAVAFYFINCFETLITDKMMGNVFNTRYSEASGFFSWTMVWYVAILGLLPAAYILMQRTDYGRAKRFLTHTGISLGLAVVMVFANMGNWTWIDRNATTLGSLLMPWSYKVNSIRWYNSERLRNRKETPLPDATIATGSKDVCVLIIGESARRANFSLYGYERHTNPLMEQDSVTALRAESAATYTTAGVKAILSHTPSSKLYEILPNYLYRNGAEVVWRTSNWGEPPVHIDRYTNVAELKKAYPDADSRYDGILLAGLGDLIRTCDKDKMLIILHTSTSHGPMYYKKYPEECEVFRPVCTTVEMSKADPQELMNAYDNTIVYTDNLIHSVIDTLRSIPERRSCMMFVSDHGESLGEGNLYMHGVPMSIAPKVQTEIPFVVWTSDSTCKADPDTEATQYHVFHTILRFLGFDSPVYNPELDVFKASK